MSCKSLLAALVIATGLAPLNSVADSDRGRDLFENHCTGCHHPSFLDRPLRHVKDRDSLRYFVERWAEEIKLGWDSREREDVVEYLNWRYYQFTLKP